MLGWLLILVPAALAVHWLMPDFPSFLPALFALVFSLVTHRRLFEGLGETAEAEAHQEPLWPVRMGLAVLALATAVVAWMSEIMVAANEPAARALGLSSLFVGVFVVAIIGNAAEHSTAIFAALRNRMDLALSIALGSSVQVALFVAPVLVLASLFSIRPGLTLCVVLSVLIAAGDGWDGELISESVSQKQLLVNAPIVLCVEAVIVVGLGQVTNGFRRAAIRRA